LDWTASGDRQPKHHERAGKTGKLHRFRAETITLKIQQEQFSNEQSRQRVKSATGIGYAAVISTLASEMFFISPSEGRRYLLL
jgi:hypothetical protein